MIILDKELVYENIHCFSYTQKHTVLYLSGNQNQKRKKLKNIDICETDYFFITSD